MVKIVKFTTEQLNNIATHLQSLPQKDDSKNKTEAIKTLAKDIDHAIKQGYSLKEICGFLKEGGLNITVMTLKAYLQKTKTSKSKSQRETLSSIKKISCDSKGKDICESSVPESETESPSLGSFVIRPDIENI